MKTRIPVRLLQHSHPSHTFVAALCHHLDHAIAPIATACLILGVVASWFHLNSPANFLMAAGLLLHLTIWFASWLESVRRH